MLWVGVPIFAVVSGYCIAASVDSLRRKPHSLSNYVVRRARRIYPPLWAACGLAIVFTFAVSLIPGAFEHTKQLPRIASMPYSSWFGNFTASELWLSSLFSTEPNYLIKNTWTLGYEEQYYILAGLMLAISPKWFFGSTAVLSVSVLVVRHVGLGLGVPVKGFFFDGNWLTFAAGILVYHSLLHQNARGRVLSLCILFAIACYGLAGKFLHEVEFDQHISEYIFVAGLFGMLLIGIRRWDDSIAKARIMAPLVWFGRRSFSIYLTHFPIVVTISSLMSMYDWSTETTVVFIAVPLGLIISLPVATWFHIAVERPFMNSAREKARSPQPNMRMVEAKC